MKRLVVLCLSLLGCALETYPEPEGADVTLAALTTPPIVCNRNAVINFSPTLITSFSDWTPDNQWATIPFGPDPLFSGLRMYISLGPSAPISQDSATQLHIRSTATGCYYAEVYAVSYCKNAWGSLPQEVREAPRWYGPNDGVYKTITRCPLFESGLDSYAPSKQAFMQVKLYGYAPKL